MNTGAGEDQAAEVGRVPTPDSETFWISQSCLDVATGSCTQTH